MGQLDASITQLVLPVLEREFGATVDMVSWVAVIYLLVVAVMLPIFGRLSDMFGRKLFYAAGFIVFVAGSAMCGLASSVEWLIAARALQAIGSAVLGANSVAIIVSAAGPERRGRAIGLQAAVQAVGLSVGPTLGGLLISEFGWRWVFWMNVPIGLVGAVIGWLVLPVTVLPQDRGRFDWWGAALLAPGLGTLLLAINQTGAWGLSSSSVGGSVAAAAILLAAFVWWEHKATYPLVPLPLFRKRSFAVGNVAGLLANAILFALFFLMPFAFERAFHQTALSSGVRLTIIPIALGLLAPLSGALSDRIGVRLLCAGGMLVVFGGLLVLFFLLDQPTPDLFLITVALAVIGIGEGAFLAPNNSAIMASASQAETSEAGSVLNVIRALGMSIGIAAAATLLSWQLGASSGGTNSTLSLEPSELLAAIRFVVGTLAGFALAASAASMVRPAAGTRPLRHSTPGDVDVIPIRGPAAISGLNHRCPEPGMRRSKASGVAAGR